MDKSPRLLQRKQEPDYMTLPSLEHDLVVSVARVSAALGEEAVQGHQCITADAASNGGP
jgi:hypothetical protein